MGIFEFLKKLFFNRESTQSVRGYNQLRFVHKKNYGLSYRIQARAIRKHNILISKFIQENSRSPTRFELGKIVVHASHMTVKYHKGNSGHLFRQKVRHYLFNLHGISYKKI